MTEPLCFADKMVKAGGLIGKLKKDGHNSFHNYDYVTEASVKAAVGPALREAGLYISSVTHTIIQTGDFSKVLCYTEVVVTDGASEARSGALGSGSDKGDKAAYKAMAGGLKYALTSLFLIPTGDDAEADEGTDKAAAKQPPNGVDIVPLKIQTDEKAYDAALRIIGQMTEAAHIQPGSTMLSKLKAGLSAEEFEKVKAAFQAKRSALEAAKGGK